MKRITQYTIVEITKDDSNDIFKFIPNIVTTYPTLKKLVVGIKSKLDKKELDFQIEMNFFNPNNMDELSIMSHRQLFHYEVATDIIGVYEQRNLKYTKDVKRVIRKLSNLLKTYNVGEK